MRYKIFILAFFFLLLWHLPLFAAQNSECVLGKDIAKKGIEIFKKDKEEALKLLLKAYKFCPNDEAINFNIGLAFFKYGNLKESEKYLKNAFDKNPNNPEILNLLAWTLLKINKDKNLALTYSKAAKNIDPENPAYFDTFLYAQNENNFLHDSLINSKKALKKWKNNPKIKKRYEKNLDSYLVYYLKKAEEKKYDRALYGLSRIDFESKIIKAYAFVLEKKGDTEKALEVNYKNKNKFSELNNAFEMIMDNFIQAQYWQFKRGKRANAYASLEKMDKKYPHKGLEKAKKNMLNAILEETGDIEIPKSKHLLAKSSENSADSMLAQLQRTENNEKFTTDDLLIDVNINIPKTSRRKPYAVAVVIGNKDYKNAPNVDYAVYDASYIKKYLINALGYENENIIYKTNASYADFNSLFGTYKNKGKLYNYVKPNVSEVFVYYSGHGAPDTNTGDAFLVPNRCRDRLYCKFGLSFKAFL
jgi:tetratricopeptide (TPR) repeat protein